MTRLHFTYLISCLGLMAGLSGCASAPDRASSVQTIESRSHQSIEILAADQAKHQRIQHLVGLLEQADLAIKQKRLTTPEGHNAYFYYHQVLQVMPSNEEARQGLMTIVDRYLQWVTSALQQGRLTNARSYLQRAQMIQADDPRIPPLRKQIALAATAKQVEQATGSEDANYFVLDAKQLRQQSPQLQQQLASIADQIFAQQSRVLISAPNDQAGRWLYLQLNNRHEDFRVRASLKIANPPSIRLLN